MIKLCLVGSGPGNCYLASAILKKNKNIAIDILEKFPTPYGLVRYGVAPDHQQVKNVQNSFDNLFKNVGFYGGIQLGAQLTLAQLRTCYHGIVLGYGSSLDKRLKIPGHDGQGIYSSNQIVGWYNGHPRHALLYPNLNTDTAVIIGNGNVALDIARILLKNTTCSQDGQGLANSDITRVALEILKNSSIKHVHVVGRRGPIEAAFTAKELREMTNLNNVKLNLDMDALKETISKNSETLSASRSRKRLLDLLVSGAESSLEKTQKTCTFHFGKSPKEFILDNQNTIKGVKFERNLIENGRAVGTNEFETIDCGLAITAIGYQGEQVDKDIPWDQERSIVPNSMGRVNGAEALYVTGWLKSGPVGTIATTRINSVETAFSIMEDENLLASREPSQSLADIIDTSRVISFDEWTRINSVEVEAGSIEGKPREKIVNIDEMYRIAKSKLD